MFFANSIFVSSAHADDAQIKRGREIYAGIGACASCHGDQGKGDGAAAAALDPKPASFSTGKFKYDTDGDGKTGTAADISNIVAKGASAFGGSMFMAARPDISEEDRKALAAYVLSLQGS